MWYHNGVTLFLMGDDVMKTLIGITLSNIYVLALLLLSSHLYKTQKASRETTRKLVHIGASNWWFMVMWYADTALTAAIVPMMFVIVNYYTLKNHLFKSIEREGEQQDLGRIFYAVSLLVITVWTFGIGRPEIGVIGVLIMGYADGFAALVGIRYGKHKLYGSKSLEGSLVAMVLTVVIVVFFNNIYAIGLTAAEMVLVVCGAVFLESVSLKGSDNLTVPIGTTFLIYILM